MMHLAAINWTVADLHGVTTASVIASLGLIPMLVSSPIGGWMADRFERRAVFLWTVVLQTITAAAASLAYAVHWRSVTTFLVLAIVGGFTGSLGAPVQQAIITDLVPTEAVRNASVLNSTQFTISRSFGPTLAGLIIDLSDPSVVFWTNTLSFVALLIALSFMTRRPITEARQESEKIIPAFISGCRYTWANRGLRVAVGAGVLVAFVAAPLQLNGQVIAKEAFDAGPTAFGLLVGGFGYGSLAAALGVLAFDRGYSHFQFMSVGLPLFGLGFFALAVSPIVALGIASTLLIGVAFMLLISTTMSSVHALCDDSYRGRVMSVWMVLWALASPAGVAVTALAGSVPIRAIIAASGVIVVLYTIVGRARGSLRLLDPSDEAG